MFEGVRVIGEGDVVEERVNGGSVRFARQWRFISRWVAPSKSPRIGRVLGQALLESVVREKRQQCSPQSTAGFGHGDSTRNR